MKTRTTNNKSSKDTSSRKIKKQDHKPVTHGKEKVEDKKLRRPIQKNRFTNIEDLQSSSALELFGSLVFNLANDTFDVQISDNTGDYELRVSNETLKQFKLKVLLGVDQRSKPKFTILLGDCQCYPELPEGTLMLKNVQTEGHTGMSYKEDNQTDLHEGVSCAETFPGSVVAELLNGKPTRIEERENDSRKVSTDSLGEQHATELYSEDEATIRSKRSKRRESVQSVGGHPPKIQVGASTYINNLEGFIKFLINDEMCYSALKKTKAPPNLKKVARRIVGGRNMIKYSDGREFIITFEEKPPDTHPVLKKETSDCPPNSIKSESESSLTTLRELLSTSDDKAGRRLDDELKAREELMEANDFVENVKKELTEWKEKCEDAVNVEIINSEHDGVAVEDNPKDDVKIRLSALQKGDDVYEDATSNSSNLAQADSLEHFFLELDEYDKMTVTKQTRDGIVDKGSKNMTVEFTQNGKANTSGEIGDGSHFTHNYVPPVPINMTSRADIEMMWMSFVKQFYPDVETRESRRSDPKESTSSLLYNSVGQHSQITDPRSLLNPIVNESHRQESFNDNIYPGQHCYPYFVEANLQRVNSVVSSFKVSSSSTSRVERQESDFPLFGYPQFHPNGSPSKHNFPAGIHVVKPSKLNFQCDRLGCCQKQRNPNTLSQEKFHNRRNRIFFNPNVSAGDWY